MARDLKSFVRAQEVVDQKAIPAHPGLMALNQDPPMYTTGSERIRTPFAQSEASRHLQAYGGRNDAIDWVMNCVRLIVETASTADWHFEKDGVKYYTKKNPDLPSNSKDAPYLLAKLFEEPNPYMNLEELFELTLIDYLLVGNAYWMKWRTNDVGQPLALYRLAPPYVKVLPGQFGVEGYTYQVPGHDPMKLSTADVVHFRAPNPHSAYLGLGLIQGGSRMLDLDLALTDTQAGYFEKRAMPSMVVQSDRRVPKEVFNRLRNQLRSMYGGPRNSGALMVLEAGLKYQSIAPSAVEAGFESLSRMSRDRILALFRVPGALLGLSDNTAVAGDPSNDQRIFDTKTMRPLLNKFQAAVTKGVVDAWGLEFVVDYDYIMPVQDRLRLASTFAALPGVRVREVREYAGLPPLGKAIDEIVLNMPGEPVPPGGHPQIASYNLAGQGGRPPNPSNTAAFPANGSIPAGGAARRTSLAAGDNTKAFIDSTAEEVSVLERMEEIMQRKALAPQALSDELLDDRTAAVDGIAATLEAEIKNAVHALERGLLDDLEGAYDGKAPGDRLRSKIRKSAAWGKFLDKLSSSIEKAAKAALSAAAVQQARLGRKPDEDIDYDALAREIVYRTGGVRKITANFKNEVAQRLATALKDGESRADLERAIRSSMDFWREGHAETVALTEAVQAYNEGTLTVAELTGHSHVYVFDGDQNDEPCIEANGQTWTIEHARQNRLQHPRCRRAFSPVATPTVI